MRTRRSNYPNNSNVTIPRRRRRQVSNIVEPEIRTIVEMAERTMEELLRAPTKGYGEAIVLPEINADHFEIKTNLLQLVHANPFYGRENENPHAHINSFKRITSTLRFRNVPNDVIKLMMFPYSLEGAAKTWYEKEPPNSILTWEDLVTKFVNQFFPPSKTTHLKNEISRFTQKFEETFSEAWERFKELLRACPHHGFNGVDRNFDQFQPPQFPINYPPQETSKEILRAREDLMEAIQAFLKEYDHIPPNEKCMALLLAEERFLKIKQAMEEEQNQPEVLQELILKLMNDLQILKGIQLEKEKQAAQGFIPYWNFSMIDDEEARDNFLKDVCTFLRKFSRIPFGVTPKVILIAWESFGKIKDALMDKQYQQEDIQELMSKLLEDVRNISEEFSEYINCPSWNRPLFYDNDDDEYTVIWRRPKAITPDLPIEEPDNSLSMGDKHLDTIPSVENLDPIPSEFEGISEDTCDVPVCEDSSTFDALSDHSEILSDSNDDDTSSDNNSYENIEYVEASPLNLEYDSLEEENEDQEEKEFDLEDIFQIQDVILCDKLFNVHLLISKIEALNDNPTLSSFSDNSFSDHTEETRSGSTTTHANNSLPEYDSFLFEIEPDQGGLISVVISNNSNDPLLELLEFESSHFDLDLSFSRPPPEPPDAEISLIIETNAPVIDNYNELNEDECFNPGGGEINVEVDDSFTFVTWTFLLFLTYPE
ncbi:reverse transcriptase domain-containing protein, partial [Tanacetum coccineum]